MRAIASGHGVVSGSAAFCASCAAAAPCIAGNANSATVILACCMRFPLMRFALPSLGIPSLLERNEITRSRIRECGTAREQPQPFLHGDPDRAATKSEVHFSDDKLPLAHVGGIPPLSRDRGRHPDAGLVRVP